ncbi:hypothetical protein BRC62_07935 [Halobacteriales archaeon QH_10_67_13]|nr:MAG: hypothetical protein BRC62_07935 [Halobacteriales archaeon QH_10_67_13]
MRDRRLAAFLIAGLCVLSLAAAPAGAGPSAGTQAELGGELSGGEPPAQVGDSQTDAQANDSAPPDPEEDVIGWEDDYWYDESVALTPENGYNESEIDRILARSMARVEQLRGLEFNETPEVNFVPREEYAEFSSDRIRGAVGENVTTKDRLHQNTKFEALFLTPEDESYFGDRAANEEGGGSASAFYTEDGIPELDVGAGDIAIIVSGDGQADLFSESTLGHELVHRLQDANLGVLDTFRGGPTEEAATLNTSFTEADATLVDQRYSQRCGEEWDCLPTPEGGAGSILDFENPGLVMYGLGPYSETAQLFAAADERGGPEAMNALYEDPPVSNEQLLHPEDYPDDTPAEIEYTDTSAEEWSVQTFEEGVNYATFGELGIFVMLYNPSLEALSTVVMNPNYPFGGVQSPSRYDFTHPASVGWDGDKMFIYTNETSAETNETGYVWETRWDSSDDAAEFVDAYTTVLTEYGGATTVGEEESVYRIPDDNGFGDAFYIETSDTAVRIVNAPTVGDLSEISEAAPEAPRDTDADANGGDDGSDPGSDTDSDEDGTGGDGTNGDGTDEGGTGDGNADSTDTDDEGPGFTIVAGLAAVIIAAFIARRRRE